MRIVQARLEGADATPGRVAAADVARIILGLERAIAQAAYLVLGRTRRGTGRHRHAIESASRLRFVGVEEGSFVELLALPDAAEPSDNELPISVADLSSQALGRLFEAINSDGSEVDSELAAAVARMAGDLGIGDRNSSLTLVDQSGPSSDASPRHAVIDLPVRKRMLRLSEQPRASRDEALVGVLFEADFEGHTAKLRLTSGNVVVVNFSDDLADDIHEALRSRARFHGLVRYNARTAEATSVELRAVVLNDQLTLDADSFWQSQTFKSLQLEQGTSGMVDPHSIGIQDLTDDERAAFLAALAR